MKYGRPRRARGATLLAMLAIIVLAGSWFLVRQLNAESGSAAAIRNARNAEVLNRAKQALIGYVAAQAANAGEDNPGALPCPEAPGYFDNASQEGQTASGCTLPKVGRFPWRTLGIEKLVDSAGEPLWYVVSPGWAATSSGFKTTINSNTPGQLTVDGTANAAVALIIAPGPAFSVAACGANAAISQARSATGPPDWRNYLECENATNPPDAAFVTTGSTSVFNDQVVRITVADIMPAIEAAVAKRIERDIVPALKSVYASTQWGTGISATNPLFPYPAPFGDPGSSNFQGAAVTIAGAPQGLLPFNQTQGCVPASDPRCTTTFLAWSSAGAVQSGGTGSIRATEPSFPNICAWESAEIFACSGAYNAPSVSLTVTVTVTNVAMGIRAQDLSKVTCTAVDDVGNGLPTQTVACSVTGVTLQSNGSAIVTVATGATPDIDASGWGTWALFKISFDRSLIGDHALLDSTATTTGWFVRNEWYRLLYYAMAPANTAAQLPGTLGCATGTNCLTVTNLTPSDNKRSLLVLAGRSLTNAPRPNGTLSDFMEFGNADGNTVFEKQPISTVFNSAANSPFNDRVIVLDSN